MYNFKYKKFPKCKVPISTTTEAKLPQLVVQEKVPSRAHQAKPQVHKLLHSLAQCSRARSTGELAPLGQLLRQNPKMSPMASEVALSVSVVEAVMVNLNRLRLSVALLQLSVVVEQPALVGLPQPIVPLADHKLERVSVELVLPLPVLCQQLDSKDSHQPRVL